MHIVANKGCTLAHNLLIEYNIACDLEIIMHNLIQLINIVPSWVHEKIDLPQDDLSASNLVALLTTGLLLSGLRLRNRRFK